MINRKPNTALIRKHIDYINKVVRNYTAGIITSFESTHSIICLMDAIEAAFLCSAMSYRDYVELNGICIMLLDEIQNDAETLASIKTALSSAYGRTVITTDDEVLL